MMLSMAISSGQKTLFDKGSIKNVAVKYIPCNENGETECHGLAERKGDVLNSGF